MEPVYTSQTNILQNQYYDDKTHEIRLIHKSRVNVVINVGKKPNKIRG